MPKIKNWEKERDSNAVTIWRHRYKPELTVEIVSFESQGMDDEWNWGYGYPALHRKGIPSSPEMFETKDDAKKWAVKWMRKHPNG